MNREFLDIYNRELRLLYESAREFADDYPGIAERLGGLIEGNIDPMIAGLLEGSAFLASRVQLKLRHEFPEFTCNLLEQILPHYMAPTPAAALLQITPPFAEPALKDGDMIPAGAMADARFIERERRIACKFQFTADIRLWPVELVNAEYLPAASALQAAGLELPPGIASGLKLTFMRRTLARRDDEPAGAAVATKPECWFSRLPLDELPIHILGPEGDAARLYEMLFAQARTVHVRHLDGFGDPVIQPARLSCLAQAGFDGRRLLLSGGNLFRGIDLLREYFVLPAKFLAFRLTGLRELFARANSNALEILIGFGAEDRRLSATVRPDIFSLYTAPAVNLFEMQTARVPVKASEHEHHVVTDRTRGLDFEAHRIVRVQAHMAGTGHKTDVYPLYSAPPPHVPDRSAIYYTTRRTQRRRSRQEAERTGTSGYVGTETYLTLANHGDAAVSPIAELSVRALCSNRGLAARLPVGEGGADFTLADRTNLRVSCIAGPTLPQESILATQSRPADGSPRDTPAWRLISLMSLNHLGITGRGTENSAAALRELLTLFTNPADATAERRIRGIMAVDSRPVVRRVRNASGSGVVRTIEISVTLDEKAFEGSGLFLFGAVIERFFADYAPVNNATQTVIRSTERGEVMRWPARLGRRVEL